MLKLQEGKNLTDNDFSVTANPAEVTYTWFKVSVLILFAVALYCIRCLCVTIILMPATSLANHLRVIVIVAVLASIIVSVNLTLAICEVRSTA